MANMTKETQSQVGLWKHKRPNVFEWIDFAFSGTLREHALEFVEWASGMGFKHKIHSTSNGGHNVFYNKEYMCKMGIIEAKSDKPMRFEITLCLENLDSYTDEIKSEGLADLPWKPNYCIHKRESDKTKICNSCHNCTKKGVDRLVFGENFTQCCTAFPAIRNPNDAEFSRIKRLLELEKAARDSTPQYTEL